MRDVQNKLDYGREGHGARRVAGASFSGHERDHLYLNRGGSDFLEVSGISGVDHPSDARSMALFDYDRDGWQDAVVANSNTPLLLMFRNRMHEFADGPAHRVVAVRLRGGNQAAQASEEWSNRDGIGAFLTIELRDMTVEREFRAGEGLAAQNSATMLIGIGGRDRVEALSVRWPSRKEQRVEGVAAGTLVTVYENAEHSPDGEAFVFEAYRREPGEPDPAPVVASGGGEAKTLVLPGTELPVAPKLRMYTTMATWCEACKGHLPELALLREAFTDEELAMFGVPIDDEDAPEKLRGYQDEFVPAYELLAELASGDRERVQALVMEQLQVEALPATVLTDGGGRVLRVLSRVPTVSEIRLLLAEARSS